MPTSATQDQVEILKTSVNQLSKMYDHVSNIYDQLRLKALALIAGEVAIVSFVFSPEANQKGIHIPDGSDRRVFYFAGISFLALAFGFLLWIISTVDWKLPHDTQKSAKIFKDKNRDTELSFLEYLHDDFCDVNDYVTKLVTKKCRRMNWAIYLLSAGVIILLVMKFGGSIK